MLRDGTLFLVDFGIARVLVPVKPGTAVGTVGYCPVEQYRGMAEPRSDLYSLGAVYRNAYAWHQAEGAFYFPCSQ